MIVIAKKNQTNDSGNVSINIVSQKNYVNQTEDKNIENLGTNKVEVVGEEEIEKENSTGLENMTAHEKNAFFRLTKVTTGIGFIIKEDKSDAQFFRGTWIVRKSAEKPKNAKDINSSKITTRRFGFVIVGIGDGKERFRIRVENATEEKIVFRLSDRNDTNIGSLELMPKIYNEITLWFGTLTLNSGNYIGNWSITASARTKIIKPLIRRPSRWNIFAFGERRKAALEEKIQERMFEREGMKKFAEEIRGKKLADISKDKRMDILDRASRIREKRVSREREK